MNSEEFLNLSRELRKYHAIFDRLWIMGQPVFTKELPTAGVYFDKVGECIDFKINPDFWNKLNDIQKQFVISHECLHTILYHGLRINKLKGNELLIANQALDIVVNHSLVDNFGFVREEVDPDNKYCWVETVFPKNPPESGKYFEFYYNLFEKLSKKDIGMGSDLVDDHSGLESFASKKFEDKLKEIISSEELSSLSDFVQSQTSDLKEKYQQAGVSPGKTFVIVNVSANPKKKWETVIKNWALKHSHDKDEEQWARLNRRLVFMNKDFILPSDYEVEDFEKEKIQVWFFQDTSGSCSGFIKRFFAAAKSLPKDRFDVKMHCFDTRVFETTLESGKLYGFGGTSFRCIEAYIQQYIRKHNQGYPRAVFCITDGFGNNVNPQFPERWHWFLSTTYTQCIPKTSKVFPLKNFE